MVYEQDHMSPIPATATVTAEPLVTVSTAATMGPAATEQQTDLLHQILTAQWTMQEDLCRVQVHQASVSEQLQTE